MINKKNNVTSECRQTKISELAVIVGLMAGVIAAPSVRASSHREAPFISEDPAADNTDTYAFVSYEPGREDYVTIIGNWIPLQEPSNGPNFFKLSDFVNYDLLIDVDGDALPDLIYRFDFITRIVDPGTYLYATGVILPPADPTDPSSQYINLNQRQSYTLREFTRGNDPNASGSQSGNGGKVLLSDVRTAPNRPGPKTLLPNPSPVTGVPGAARGDTSVAYQNLAQMAVHTIPNAGGARAFVGPRDEGFYVDLGSSFDRINPRAPFAPPGADGTGGFNVSTLAIEIPKARLRAAGDTDGIIGVWAAASRVRLPVCNTLNGKPDSTTGPIGDQNTPCTAISKSNGKGTQVSRLANPLFSEFLNPIRAKDFYNASRPKDDERNIAPYILNPATTQGPNTLVQQLRDFTQCTDTVNRHDQIASFMLGYPAGVVNGFPGNRETQTSRPALADLMRLNYNIPSVPGGGNPLGVLAGDFAGFPNGRRVSDDSVDILVKLWGGVIQDRFGGTPCEPAAALNDGVPANDVPYLQQFPYLGLPQEGFNHRHRHEDPGPPTP